MLSIYVDVVFVRFKMLKRDILFVLVSCECFGCSVKVVELNKFIF